MTLQPIAASRSRCGVTAAISSAAERRASCALYQPDTSASSWRARIGRSTSACRGNLPPSSMPAKPACRVSARHTSSGMSPPSSGMSSLVHVIGLMPSVTMRASQELQCGQFRSKLLGRSKVNAVYAEARRGDGVVRIVVDEHRFVRRNAIAIEQDLEDARVRLDDAFVSRHDDAVEQLEKRKTRSLRR